MDKRSGGKPGDLLTWGLLHTAFRSGDPQRVYDARKWQYSLALTHTHEGERNAKMLFSFDSLKYTLTQIVQLSVTFYSYFNVWHIFHLWSSFFGFISYISFENRFLLMFFKDNWGPLSQHIRFHIYPYPARQFIHPALQFP